MMNWNRKDLPMVRTPTSDLIIVGGGIHGAAMLWEAASRGLSAVLLEQGDFACATSANSLKIIHGGIRYLQDLDPARVQAAAAERHALLHIAPHLVEPLTCVVPTYHSLFRNRVAMRAAFSLYDLLTRRYRKEGLDPQRCIATSRLISRASLLRILPWLENTTVTGGACWQDAQVWNTERLVLSFVLSAVAAGARAYNYTRVERLIVEKQRVVGVMARDVQTGAEQIVSASLVVDCRGPWQGTTLTADGIVPAAPARHFARAYNLLLRRPLADIAFGVQPPGDSTNRLLFSTPWRGGSIIGTWYDRRRVIPESLALDEKDITRALAQINRALPGLNLQRHEVAGVHVGLLPCEERGDRAGEPVLQKRPRILAGVADTGLDGLILVQGVKYTTARQVAENVVSNHVASSLGRSLPPSRTRELPLYGGDIADLRNWRGQIMARFGSRYGHSLLDRLMRNYGMRLEYLMAYVEKDPAMGECIPGLDDTLQAEVVYILENERARTLADVILRRTDIGSFCRPPQETLEHCCRMMARRLGWDEQRQEAEIQAVLAAWEKVG